MELRGNVGAQQVSVFSYRLFRKILLLRKQNCCKSSIVLSTQFTQKLGPLTIPR